ARNTSTVTLVKEKWTVPSEIILPNGNPIVPFFAGEEVNWKVKNA
ncbi:dihydroorotase, partial [Shewanella sp. 0m-11]